MKEQIYTIPINESFERRSGCPVCRLESKLETDALEYITGAAMMEPDVRIKTNRMGFCHRHYTAMAGMNSRLSLALMLESHLSFIGCEGLARINSKKTVKTAAAVLEEVAASCFVCARTEEYLAHYYDNIAYMWKTEAHFRSLFDEQESICFRHTAGQMGRAVKVLSASDAALFGGAVNTLLRKTFAPISGSISSFTKSFDYRFAGELSEDDKASVENAICMLTGEES